MTRRRKVLAVIAGFALVYLMGEAWIGNSVRTIMVTGMKNDIDYSAVMTEEVYHKLNSWARGMNDHISYNPDYWGRSPCWLRHLG